MLSASIISWLKVCNEKRLDNGFTRSTNKFGSVQMRSCSWQSAVAASIMPFITSI